MTDSEKDAFLLGMAYAARIAAENKTGKQSRQHHKIMVKLNQLRMEREALCFGI